MAEITILEQTTLDNFEDQGAGYLFATMDTEALLTEGETYRVVWNGTEYSCLSFAADKGICVGNAGILGGPDTGEPFIVASIPGALYGQELNVISCAATEGASHTFAIYQAGEAESIPSATVKIKGYSGAEFTYENVPRVWLAAPESTLDNPVLVPFTYGEAVDDVEIVPDFSSGDHEMKMPAGEMARSAVVKKPDSLIPGNIKAGETVAGITGEYEGEVPETEEVTIPADFSAGDMVVEPSEGKYLSKATVQMPETLIPENIAEGVDIAGIIGTLIGSSNAIVSGGLTSFNTESGTIKHSLGVVPDFVIIWCSVMGVTGVILACGFSSSFTEKYYSQYKLTGSAASNRRLSYDGSSYAYGSIFSGNIDGDNTDYINNANETTISVGSSKYPLTTGQTYNWIAIGGLT